ncbi:hypothetical protein [Allosphingosinicella indica]|uniref:Orc1-like AAA ATPase domain-containing protein n=1 Tax=Allosphingosinicella indica TaxID=941907 RepID=A0A1X7G3T4_9SPHN|nr:hypothetical protein [Allosphingosinicella indica]SMF63539.1 hypothetical protein SAMN06295910_1094 [Allosphingosinicella indica]
MKFEDYDLRQDPFPIAPESSVHNWAGDHELRDELVDIVKGVRARDIGVSEFIVINGELGAGKSHALRYLRTLICESPNDFDSLAVYLERPRVANKLNFENLAKYIVQSIGRDTLSAYCSAIARTIDEIVEQLAHEKGMGGIKDKGTFYEEAYNQLKESDRPMARLLARGTRPGSKVFEFLTGADRCDGPEYEGKIDSDFMAAKVLGDFFRVLTAEFPNGKRIKESIYFFLDECEMLLEAKTSESDLVFSGLRELINGLPYRFCLMMSFTAATALIEAVMPNHLLKRLTRDYIEVPMLSDAMAVEFLRSQLNYYRTAGSSHVDTFYPFSTEAVEAIVEDQTSLTPRSMFIQCKRVFERAIRRHGVESGDVITREIAEKIMGH